MTHFSHTMLKYNKTLFSYIVTNS